jgi:hypothetical protein
MEKQRNKALEQMVNAHIETPAAEPSSAEAPPAPKIKAAAAKAGAIAKLEAAKTKATRKVPVMGHVAPEIAEKVDALASRYHVSKSEAVAILLEEALTQLDK